MRAITQFFVTRWQFTLVVFLMLFVLGWNALFAIPKAEDPVTKFPGVNVTVILPGANAEEIEQLVAIPLEKVLNRLDDIDQINSRSEDGVGQVGIQFTWGVDADRKLDEVTREVTALRPSLPQGVVDFRIRKFDPAEAAIIQVALVSKDAPTRQMEALAKDLRDLLERVNDVQSADIWGAPPSEVSVELDPNKLAQYKIPPNLVAAAMRQEGRSDPLGALESGNRRFNIKATGSYQSLEEIAQTTIRARDGAVLRLGDIAKVEWSNAETRHLTRFNGQRAVFVTAKAKSGADVFRVTKGVDAALKQFELSLPKDIKLEAAFRQKDQVLERLNHLSRDFLIAILLVLITLLPLGPRAALIVMTSIPLSLALGVVSLNLLGYSLNQLSIAGFILALGLLVDDSIVVTENIARHLRQGLTPRQAAIEGVGEINVAVLGCTGTLLFAFLPLLNLPGGPGAFIRSLPVAVTLTIIASLIVSLTIIPFLASTLLNPKSSGHSNPVLDGVMGGIHAIYRPVLHWALLRPLTCVLAGLALCVASFALIPAIGFSLFPANESPYFIVDVETPEGSALSETDAAVQYADKVLASQKEIVWRFANTGRGNPQIYYNVIPAPEKSNKGSIYASVKKFEGDKTIALMNEIRGQLHQYPRARFQVNRFENGPPLNAPIEVFLHGRDLATLRSLAQTIEERIRAIPGTRDVENPIAISKLDLNLNLDTQKAALLGVEAGALDDNMRVLVGGLNVTDISDSAGDSYPVILRGAPLTPNDPSDKNTYLRAPTPQDLDRLFFWTQTGDAIPVSALADPRFEPTPSVIDRHKLERSVAILARIQPGFLTSRVTEAVMADLATLQLPPGYSFEFGGEAESASESFSGLGAAIVIAVFGVLAILLLEFGAFSQMLVVAFVIPFGIMGGLVALFVTGNSLSFTAVIGFVALVGIEIKNSILLVDFANQLRKKGVPVREAVEQAGELRFLPVLLTSLTAIGGLLTLAIEGSKLYGPLAIVIIGGLISSTMLARIVTPAMYLLLAGDKKHGARNANVAAKDGSGG